MNIDNLWKKYSLSFFQETTFSTRFPCQGSEIIKNQKIPSQKWKIRSFLGDRRALLENGKGASIWGRWNLDLRHGFQNTLDIFGAGILVLIILTCHLLMFLYFSWMQRIPIAITSWSGSPCLCHHQDHNIAKNTPRLGLLQLQPTG